MKFQKLPDGLAQHTCAGSNNFGLFIVKALQNLLLQRNERQTLRAFTGLSCHYNLETLKKIMLNCILNSPRIIIHYLKHNLVILFTCLNQILFPKFSVHQNNAHSRVVKKINQKENLKSRWHVGCDNTIFSLHFLILPANYRWQN